MSRAEHLIPDGWTVRPGSRVRLVETKSHPEPAAGAWRVIDRAPGGWWLQPADDVARGWLGDHAGDAVQGCIVAGTSRLVPARSEPPAAAAAGGS